MAIALQKKIYLFRDDSRICTNDNKYPFILIIGLNYNVKVDILEVEIQKH